MRVIPTVKSQAGYQQGSAGPYTIGGGDITFANDMMMMFRFPTDIPKGAAVSSATLTMNVVAKSDTTAQQASFQVGADIANAGSSAPLVPGVAEWPPRWRTVYWQAFTLVYQSYPANADNFRMVPINVTGMLQELVNRADWQSGGYVTIMIYVADEQGSDMSFRANNDFAPKPQLEVTWSTAHLPAASRYVTQVNLLENPRFDPAIDFIEQGRADSVLPTWFQNSHFGTWTDPANFGAFARADAGFGRVAGRYAAQFTVGPPPASNDRAAGMYANNITPSLTPHIFNGWVYIPSAVTSRVDFQSVYEGGNHTITARDQWVPFCTNAVQHNNSAGYGYQYWIMRIFPPLTQGWKVYISEPGVFASEFRQMPWSTQAPSTARVVHSSSNYGRGARRWRPNTIIGGTNRSKWAVHQSGLLTLAESGRMPPP